MSSRRVAVSSALVGIAALTLSSSPSQAADSKSSPKPAPSARAGNGVSDMPDVTVNGRYVVFQSTSTNLVPGDTNGRTDIFIRDTGLNKTRLVSKGFNGQPANGHSSDPVVSDDGKIVVFTSAATNLVPGDTNKKTDVFRTDLTTGKTTRVSTSQAGVQGNGDSKRGRISSDGRTVAFISNARNLVPGDTNNVQDVFLRSYASGAFKRVSTTPNGTQLTVPSYSPSVSFDGKYIGWVSDPFGDPAVNSWCGSVGRTVAVLSRTSPTAARPTVTEAVCKGSYLSKVVDPKVNMTGKVGYTLLSSGGYAEFIARGSGNLYDYSYDADYWSVTSWDLGRWGGAMVYTSNYEDYIHVRDMAWGAIDTYWPAKSLALSPDGATVALADTYDQQIYIWNHQTGASKLVSTS